MPYIKQEDRKKFEDLNIKDLKMVGLLCNSSGELNYALTKICLGYLNKLGCIRYSTINDIIGVLECIKHELYRRVVSHYEDLKIKENGDVYD